MGLTIGWVVVSVGLLAKVVRMVDTWELKNPLDHIVRIDAKNATETTEQNTTETETAAEDTTVQQENVEAKPEAVEGNEIIAETTTNATTEVTAEITMPPSNQSDVSGATEIDRWMSNNFPVNPSSIGKGCAAWNCTSAYNTTTGLWFDRWSNTFGALHESQNNELTDPNQKCEHIFIGDSITYRWGGFLGPTSQSLTSNRTMFNEGFNTDHNGIIYGHDGDRIMDIGWRLKNGDGFKKMRECLLNPNVEKSAQKSMILLIGTNDVTWMDHDASMRDYENLMHQFAEFLEDVNQEQKVVLYVMAIFPRGNGWNQDNPSFYQIQFMNEYLASFVDQQDDSMQFVDCNDQFLANTTNVEYQDKGGHSHQFMTGVIEASIMPDRLHLSVEGYQRWTDCLKKHMNHK